MYHTRTDLSQLLKEISKKPRLIEPERLRLIAEAQAGNLAARNRVVEGHLLLVVNTATKYYKYGVELDDLVEEGTVGLITAVERFDLKRVIKFTTYAMYWIKQAMTHALRNRWLIHVPFKLQDTWADVTYKGKSVDDERRQAHLLESAGAVMRGVLHETPDTFNLTEVSDRLLTEDIADTEERVNLRQLVEDTLPEPMLTVIKLRFGLGRREPMTLEMIAKQLGVSRERVRQREVKALTLLRGVMKC